MYNNYNLNKHRYYLLKMRVSKVFLGGGEGDPQLYTKDKEYLKYFPPQQGVDMNKLMMSDVGLYSISHYKEAVRTIDIMRKYLDGWDLKELIITESNGGVGGDTLAFSQAFGKVQTVELADLHCNILINNLKVYGYTNVNIICSNYRSVYKNLKQDVLFMDPPWGGRSYKEKKQLELLIDGERIENLIVNLFNDDQMTKLVVVKVPFNFGIEGFRKTITAKHKTNIFVEPMHKYLLIVVRRVE